MLVGFNDAKKIYNDAKLKADYNVIDKIFEEELRNYKITNDDIKLLKWEKAEFKNNAEHWKDVKNTLPTKQQIKNVIPNKKDWNKALPTKQEQQAMYDRLTADLILHPIDITRSFAKASHNFAEENFKFIAKNSIDYSKNIYKDSRNVVVDPYNTIKKVDKYNSKVYSDALKMYYNSQNRISGSAKYSARMFWVAVEDTYYLVVEMPAKFAFNTLKSISDVGAPVILIPTAALVSASAYLPIPFVAVGSSLMLVGEVLIKGTLSTAEYLTQYVVRPTVVSSFLIGGMLIKSSGLLIDTTVKTTFAIALNTGEFILYTVKPVVGASVIATKAIMSSALKVEKQTAKAGLFVATNTVNAGIATATFGYSFLSTNTAVVGGVMLDTFHFFIDFPAWVSSHNFRKKYKQNISVITNVKFDKISDFALKYIESDSFKKLLTSYNLTDVKIEKDIKDLKAKIFVKSDKGNIGLLFRPLRRKNNSVINVIFGFDKTFFDNAGVSEVNEFDLMDSFEGFVKVVNKE